MERLRGWMDVYRKVKALEDRPKPPDTPAGALEGAVVAAAIRALNTRLAVLQREIVVEIEEDPSKVDVVLEELENLLRGGAR